MAKPLFRKVIFPWYYAKSVQILIIIIGLLIIFFAVVGISVAGEYENSHKFIWIPGILLVAAGALVVVAIYRLKRAISQKTSGDIDFGF